MPSVNHSPNNLCCSTSANEECIYSEQFNQMIFRDGWMEGSGRLSWVGWSGEGEGGGGGGRSEVHNNHLNTVLYIGPKWPTNCLENRRGFEQLNEIGSQILCLNCKQFSIFRVILHCIATQRIAHHSLQSNVWHIKQFTHKITIWIMKLKETLKHERNFNTHLIYRTLLYTLCHGWAGSLWNWKFWLHYYFRHLAKFWHGCLFHSGWKLNEK